MTTLMQRIPYEHYVQAERLIRVLVDSPHFAHSTKVEILAAAQVHATLALFGGEV